MAGPGTFHFAIGVDVKGNSCVQSLAQNTASVIVSEMMGDGMYQVKPNEQVMFHSGKVGSPDHQPGTCGCAPAATEVMRAEARPPAPRTEPAKPEIPVSLAQPLPAEDLHVQVDAPFVYSGSDADPVILEGATHLRVTAAPALPIIVLPPPASQAQAAPVQASAKAPEKPPEKRKFFGKVRAFFASIFR
jgi:hypothetical protein